MSCTRTVNVRVATVEVTLVAVTVTVVLPGPNSVPEACE